ncbi:D-2-hydroxyacid dehydrogenase [Aeromicrobium halocynthiae]|uniref:D-2-hydroxyacid dehydrogenase n=1 Tax=Aeromicrobium halocynthiae TaxID=560557 RepID=A0ABN2VQS5_9ACTN
MTLNVVVAGLPKAVQGATDPDEGIWLTDEQKARITGVADDVWLEHVPVSVLNAGQAPQRPPHAIMVETSGSKPELDVEQGILTGPGFEQLMNSDLRLLQSMSAGAEHLVRIIPEGVTLANASGVAANAIAETVIAGILGDAKLLRQRWAHQQSRTWRELPARELEGSVLTVLGTGNIGARTAQVAKVLGMHTIGVNRRGNAVDGFDEVVATPSLHEVLGRSDYFLVAAPLTPETRGLVDADAVKAMKPGCWISNVARGAICDPGAIIDGLHSGRLRGALIDCHVEEPLPAEDPLWSAPGAEVLPHDSHASQLLGDRQVDVFVDNLQRLVDGREFRNVVDLARGY